MTKKSRMGHKTRRRVAGLVALAIALLAVGGLYAALVPHAQQAQADSGQSALESQGKQVYDTTCITCHGKNLEGVKDRGPSLLSIGQAAVYFQTSTGRMPLVRQEAQAERKPPKLTPDQIDAVGAYIQAHGGGPTLPAEHGMALRGKDTARGSELFRLNCASCHNFTGRGGALSSGKFAPSLDPATEEQMYAAMLTGPQNMPRFSDRQLTPEEKKDIIGYIKSVTDNHNSPGGNALGGFGPASEGVIAWVVGIIGIVAITMWIGSKAGHE